MELKENMLFRTKAGTIGKIDSFTEDKKEFYFDSKPIFSDGECIGSKWGYTKNIVKASYNIIDLIEVGDYVNGMKVFEVMKNTKTNDTKEHLIVFSDEINNTLFSIYADDIKSIITHEQFESISYKVD